MIEIIKKTRRKLLFFFKFKYKLIKLHFLKKKVFICVESAVHNNMGDHALGYCRKELLKKIGIHNSQIIDFSTRDRMKYWEFMKKSISNSDVILLRGGGFFGDLWEDGFEIILEFIEEFPDNTIILFPQSVYFSETENGNEWLNKSKEIISGRENLYIFARDFKSYDKFKNIFPKNNVYCTPDTVLSYKPKLDYSQKENKAILCLRNDREKRNNGFNKSELKKLLSQKGLTVIEQDTCVDCEFKTTSDSEEKLYELWNKFSSSKIVITDRLHGMIFSAITGTPCIVFDNIDHKVYNAYQWIEDLEYVKCVDDKNELEKMIDALLHLEHIIYPIETMIKKFEPLTSLILKINDKN